MARSANFYGLHRGSTKSHTYSVNDGKQITKDRVEGGKNPRSIKQMTQRCIIATVAAAYSAMKSVCNHSFEECTAGMHCMSRFTSRNYKQVRLAMESGNTTHGFCKYQQSGLVAGSYIISEGSLPDPCPDAVVSSIDIAGRKITIDLASGNSIAAIAKSMGLRHAGSLCTVVLMYPKASGNYGFGAVRLAYKGGSTTDVFAVDVIGDVVEATPAYTSNVLKVEVTMSRGLSSAATPASTYLAAIASRYVNGIWLRSEAQFNVTDAKPTFAQAIETYPVGMDRFLNGGAAYSAATAGGNVEDDSTNSGTSAGGNTGGNTSTGSGTGTGGTTTGGGSTDPDSGDGGE